MATTLHDSALGENTASGGALATADNLAVTTGDLIVLVCKGEGASTTCSGSDGQSNSYGTACAFTNSSQGGSSGDLWGTILYATATGTGNITPSMTPAANRPFRAIKAYSFTPSALMSLVLDSGAAIAQGTSTAPSAGAQANAGAGAAVVGFALYGGRTITPNAGNGWGQPLEFNTTSACLSEYQITSGAGTLTGNATINESGIQWIALMAIFKEQAAGGGSTVPQQNPSATRPSVAAVHSGSWRERLSGLLVPDRAIYVPA